MEKFRSGDFSIGILCFFQGSAFLTEFVTSISGTQSWIPILAAICVSIIMALIYTTAAEKYSGKNLIDINKEVFGKTAGSIIGWLYVFFFISLGAISTNIMGYFFRQYIMPDTPIEVFMIMFLAVCAYSAEKGVANLMRVGFLFFWIVFTVTVIDFFFLLKDMEPDNFLPLFTKGAKNYAKGGYTFLATPLLETIVFFMFTDYIQDGKTKKAYLKGLIAGGFLLLAIVLRDILTLGPSIEIISVQNFETLRLINIANILTRVETLFAFLLLMTMYFKTTLILCSVMKGINQLTGVNSKGFTYSVAAFICVYALIFFESSIQIEDWGTKTSASFKMPFEILLPVITFIAIKIKGAKA